jgi:hypothetical protein
MLKHMSLLCLRKFLKKMKKQRRIRKPFAVGLDLYVFVFGFEKHLVKKMMKEGTGKSEQRRWY